MCCTPVLPRHAGCLRSPRVYVERRHIGSVTRGPLPIRVPPPLRSDRPIHSTHHPHSTNADTPTPTGVRAAAGVGTLAGAAVFAANKYSPWWAWLSVVLVSIACSSGRGLGLGWVELIGLFDPASLNIHIHTRYPSNPPTHMGHQVQQVAGRLGQSGHRHDGHHRQLLPHRREGLYN